MAGGEEEERLRDLPPVARKGRRTEARRKPDAVGFKEHPYDALIEEYEPGTTVAELKELFAGLTRELVPLIRKIADSPKKPDRSILEREYPVDRQKVFAESAAVAFGFDFAAGRLDTTAHPFCSGIGPGDCRITTRYNPRFFSESFFGVLHETGHALYEQNLPAEHFGTPLGVACSFGIHESQSRLWENQVGRGRPFWEHFFPRLKQTFPARSRMCRPTRSSSRSTTCGRRSFASRPTRRRTTCTSRCGSSWNWHCCRAI